MMKSFPRARWAALISIVALAFVSGGWLLRPRPSAEGGVYQQARLFEDVVAAIHQHYVDPLDEGNLYERASDALVKSLKDPYAELLVKDGYREYQRQMTGTEVDLGLEKTPTESGARGHGSFGAIAPGDQVLSIDGKSTKGWSARKLDEELRSGSAPIVTLLVLPKGAHQPVVRRLTRTEIHVPAASEGMVLQGNIGYVILRRMSDGAAEELRQAVDHLVAEGVTGLVLDLRSNPGGLIREGVGVASLFLHPDDTVATSVGRSSRQVKSYLAGKSGDWNGLRLVVLVNRGTASSAELVAGALQDHDRAVIAGTPSFGKGVLQTTYPLADEVALKLTTARWFTPSGRSVQRPRADTAGGVGNRPPSLLPRTFRTDAGRPVQDASGVLPDLLVRSLPRSEGERLLVSLLGDDMDHFRDVMVGYAAELRAARSVSNESFTVTPEMRDGLFERLQEAGVRLDRATFDQARGYVDEQLGYEIARELFGSDSMLRRQAKTDRQIQAALRILRGSRTQQEALTFATTAQLGGRFR
ncbi:MAG: S41 family peptidase [Gemmatimonadales bacterium]